VTNKGIDDLAIGDFVCDMHYGTRKLAERFKVVSQVQWGMTTPASFPTQSNKELRVIGFDRSGAVVCAYNYDNIAQGIVVLEAKETV
jgi:hypothetical protein